MTPSEALTQRAVIVDALERESPVPLYYQLKQILRSKVDNGEWNPGDQIPTEDELCERYQVSRITVKRAISALVGEGLLYRRQGKGTFVLAPKIEQGPVRLTSFSEQMRQRGLRPGGVLLKQQVVLATKKIAERLGVEVGTPAIQLERLRLADDQPMGIQTAHVPLSRCPELLEEDVGSRSLYKTLEKYGVRPVSAIERYEAGLVERYEADLLHVPAGSPAFLVERIAYDANDVTIEYVKSIMRGDRYVVTIVLQSETS